MVDVPVRLEDMCDGTGPTIVISGFNPSPRIIIAAINDGRLFCRAARQHVLIHSKWRDTQTVYED
jgi:hypothetical protein